MAQTKSGQKFERITGHTRKMNGKTIEVRPHIRSNPRTSTGKSRKQLHAPHTARIGHISARSTWGKGARN